MKTATRWSILGGILLAAACASIVVQAPNAPPPPVVLPPPPPRPMVAAPAQGFSQGTMPVWASTEPEFPFLSGEDTHVTRSVGTVSDGYLVNGVPIPSPHPFVAILPIQNRRRLNYTSQQMLALILAGADRVDRSFPGSPLYLGNFSAQGGGDIPYSVSHNSGRDGDVAFYVLDASNQPVEPRDLLPLDESGTYLNEDSGEFYRFDVARNWALIEGFLSYPEAALQYIFVSKPLKNMLIAHAESVSAPPGIIALARKILWQPGGALPHDDHFHLRIYCSEADVAAGCVDTGRRRANAMASPKTASAVVVRASKMLSDPSPEARLVAVRRLGVMKAFRIAPQLASLLSDPDPRVRSAVARTLSTLGRENKALAARLPDEGSAEVRLEIITALGRMRSKVSSIALTAALDDEGAAKIAGVGTLSERAIVADALLQLEDSRPVRRLVEVLATADPSDSSRIVRALKVLTNQSHETADGWAAWYKSRGRRPRPEWLVAGFQDAGFNVKRLNIRNVWDLCRAIEGPDYVSYNAQRTLMRLAKREVPSLNWSKDDAYFYWRRWFERRAKRYGAPPIPSELSTLKDESK